MSRHNAPNNSEEDKANEKRSGSRYFAAGDSFVLTGPNWETHTATCPQGKQSRQWQPDRDVTGQEVIQIRFAKKDG